MALQGRERLDAALKSFQMRDRPEAAAHLRALDAENPALGDSWGAVSRLAMAMGEVSLALSAANRYVAGAPGDLARQLTLAAARAQSGRVREALEQALAIRGAHQNAPRLLHFLGVCYAQLGETGQAEEAFRAALRLLPPEASAPTWLALADLKRFEPDDADIAALKTAIGAAREPEARSTLLYALGKALDDSGDTEGAFKAYAEGAALSAPRVDNGRDATSKFVDSVVKDATREAFARLKPSQVTSEKPIFVLGLPRSGTTLVEQILASHSAVSGGAELNLFRAASMRLPGYGPSDLKAFDIASGSSDSWTAMGEDYLHLLDERFGREGRVIDKTLNHSRFLGLIHHILPRARFIWLRRDLGDTAWSIFRTRFAQGMNWTWSLADIGRHAAEEDRLHAHWTSQFPEAILSVPYEALVEDTETWSRKILNHCGLPFEPGVLEFHKNNRPVHTASAGQVRRPVYATSVGGGRRYADNLTSVFTAYDEALRRQT